MELGNYAKLDWIQMYKYSISNKVVTKCTVSNHYDAIFQESKLQRNLIHLL